MVKIDIKGDVVDNLTGQLLDMLQEPYISPYYVQNSLDQAQGSDVELDIASYGGDVFAASEIYTMLKQYSGKVTGVIQAMAASAASIIAEACDHLVISPAGQMMIHKAQTDGSGNADDFTHTAGVLNTTDRTIAGIYEAKTGKSEAEVLKLMKNETYLTAQDAVDQGFADEVMQDAPKDEVPQVINSLHTIPNKDAVKKFMSLLKMQKSVNNQINRAPKPDSDDHALFDAKLKMLKGE